MVIWICTLHHAFDKCNEVTGWTESNPANAAWKKNWYSNAQQAGITFLFMIGGISNTYFNGDQPFAFLKFMKKQVSSLLITSAVALVVMQMPKHYFS